MKMNDSYLSKAKRIDNGDWVQGVPFEIEGKTVILIKDNENLLRTHYLEENMWTAEIYAIEVDSSTICQCTGLKDKNGKLIWENDVVKDKYMKYRVIWSEEEGSWMLQTVSESMYGIGSINSEKYVVVGNFFDEGSENIGKGAEEN